MPCGVRYHPPAVESKAGPKAGRKAQYSFRCKQEYCEAAYRAKLLATELEGFRSDLLCLQEVSPSSRFLNRAKLSDIERIRTYSAH